MGSFEASYKAFNLHILSAELDEVQYIHYLTVVCTYQQDQQRGGGTELNAMWNKSWAGARSCHTNAAALEGGGAQCAVLYKKLVLRISSSEKKRLSFILKLFH